MKKIIFILAFALCLTAYCGKLEDFADDFEEIVKNARVVERLDSRAKYRNDFKLKLFRLQADASDIQMVASQIGIRDITIGADVKNYISTINVDKKANIKQEVYESRSFTISDIRRQIKYLKNLRFSVERRTFVPNKYYLDDLNVLLRFSHRWDQCKRIAFSKNVHSPFAIAEYQKRYFGEIQKLSRMIDQKVKRDKLKISDRYQLTHNVDRFVTGWKINASHFQETRKRYRDNNHSGNYRTSPEVDARLEEMKLLASEIERDLNYLVESGFSMYIKDKRFSEEQLKEMRARLNKDRRAERALPKRNDKIDPAPMQEEIKVDARKVTRLYNQKKQMIYDSESKMNGVSQSYYNKYKALLPPKQKQEMDAILKTFIDDSYPPALARSSAVKMIHIKYRDNRHGCSPEELMKLMKITPGDIK
ncbi:MAG: hypothetical protein E7040_05725 [Lentisphaerae bacterium]|nr:hypothetical protein [Lentisphaerota bacterium]